MGSHHLLRLSLGRYKFCSGVSVPAFVSGNMAVAVVLKSLGFACWCLLLPVLGSGARRNSTVVAS